MKNKVTRERLVEEFDYDPETGLFTRHDGTTKNMNETCWGYFRIKMDGKGFQAHTLAWLYVYGEIPEQQIDHINLDKLDNRIANLRLATSSQQMANNRIKRTNTSGAKGVVIRKRSKPYDAAVIVNGKYLFQGAFATLDEAAHAYNKAAIHYFGDFAVLNPIGQDKASLPTSIPTGEKA